MIREHERDETGAVASRLDVGSLSRLDVNQFYGIEIGEFPARIAEVALWMMDHLMNNELSLEFGQSYARIPLKQSPHIRCADALEMDWEDLLPAEDCSFVFGNPPFGGAKFQSPEQRAQVRRIAALGGSGGTLDYVTAWFMTAGDYIQKSGPPGEPARIGFVATNSITQGEQVAQLWPILFGRCRLEIAYAHRTFAWGSDARGMAHVHVVIIGLNDREGVPVVRRLFSYDDPKGDPHESGHRALSPYLFDAGGLADPHLVVREESRPLNGMPQLLTGSQPIDGGHTIFTTEEMKALLADEPDANSFLHPFVGAREYLQGGERFILALQRAAPNVLRNMPLVRERLAAVRSYRKASKRKSTLKLADTPSLWQINLIPAAPFLVVPEVSSERRDYAPIGWPGAARHSEQPGPYSGERHTRRLWACDLGHAHVLASAHRRTPRESVPVLDRPRLQHVSASTQGRRSFASRCLGPRCARRPRRPSRRDPRRPLRSGPHAAEPPPRAPGARPRGGPPLPAAQVFLRARARRASLRTLRADARPAGRERQEEDQTPAGSACPPFLNMDRETQVAPASGADPSDAGNSAVERRPPDPPGTGTA